MAVLLLAFLSFQIRAQSVITLENCGFSYIDPQDQATHTSPAHDTLVYTSYFTDAGKSRAFYVDLNAFGGQQVDRGRVWAILPDQTLKDLGAIAFGNCVDCIDGFALVHEGALQVSGVTDKNAMNMWLESFNQPPFALPGNLQTLTGVGRISGRIPLCAVGFKVEFIVYSNPASTTTEFSCHILCPEVIADCAIAKSGRIDCQKDSLFLEAVIPAGCFPADAKATWRHSDGWSSEGPAAARSLAGHLGWYYLEVEDECCIVRDSVLLESPPFADAGPDLDVCDGDALNLAGTGGLNHHWTLPDGSAFNDSILVFNPLSATQSGIYILNATNAEGCPDTDTLELAVHTPLPPEVEYAPPCIGDTLELKLVNAPDYQTFSWAGPQGGALPQNPVIAGFREADAGIYTLTLTDGFGCQKSVPYDISGKEPPGLETDIRESCDSVRVTLSPPDYAYQWSSGTLGPEFASATGGEFAVTVTDPAGCSAVRQVLLPEPEGPEVNLTVNQPKCPGDTGELDIELENPDQPAVFSIDGGQSFFAQQEVKNLAAGNYTLTVMDDLGCIQEFPVEVVAPDTLFVNLPLEELLVRPLTPVSLSAETYGQISRIQWLPGSIDTGEPNTEFTAVNNMDIRIIVEDERGCLATDGFPLTIELGEIYIPNAFSPDGDGLNDRFTFYSDGGSGERIVQLFLFDRWGALVFQTGDIDLNVESLGWDGNLGGRRLPQGVYAYYGTVRFGNGVIKAYKGDVTLLRKQ